MNEMYHFSRRNMNCRVRVHTHNGQCFEGVIENVDRNNLYLRTSDGVRISAWFGAGLLTLSLFSLLAIALI